MKAKRYAWSQASRALAGSGGGLGVGGEPLGRRAPGARPRFGVEAFEALDRGARDVGVDLVDGVDPPLDPLEQPVLAVLEGPGLGHGLPPILRSRGRPAPFGGATGGGRT